jgi:sulfate adenylyltransferase large subunit
MDTLKFVIVGHIDHGKSTLIGRLLYDTNSLPLDKIEETKLASQRYGRETEFAYFLDHLEEERRQGITIDTTQVFFKTKKRRYVIIDAPGHVEFVKNMITGASQAEAGVLIVDVKEGTREQTRRHAYILSLLGLEQIIVVLNKMDLVGYSKDRFEEAKRIVGDLLDSINIKPLFYIPISALKGQNIVQRSTQLSWFDGPTFLESLDVLKTKLLPQDKPLIFPVQDIYKIENKRIIVGRVEAGRIKKGDTVRVLPQHILTKIKSIELYLENTDWAEAGQSIGLTTKDPVFIERGDIVCSPRREPLLTCEFEANIFWMAKKDFNKREHLRIRCATQESICQIKTIKKRVDSSSLKVIERDTSTLKNLEVAEVSIITEKPIAVKNFLDVQELGRFVLVRDGEVCAGGIVV